MIVGAGKSNEYRHGSRLSQIVLTSDDAEKWHEHTNKILDLYRNDGGTYGVMKDGDNFKVINDRRVNE